MICVWKTISKTFTVVYTCISMIGCTTTKLITYSQKPGEIETRIWQIESIQFAAISDYRFVRICLEFNRGTKKIDKEFSFDFHEIIERHNAKNFTTSALEQVNINQSDNCSFEVEADEQELPTRAYHSKARDIESAVQALKGQTLIEPQVSLLHHESGSFLIFTPPTDFYDDLDEHTLGFYEEEIQHGQKAVLFLLPLTIAFDAAIIAVGVVFGILCPIFFITCIPGKLFLEGGLHGVDD